MGMKLRVFIARESFRANGLLGFVPKGCVLEVFGSLFVSSAHKISPVKKYSELDLTKWKEITFKHNITEVEMDSPYLMKIIRDGFKPL